MITEMDRAWLAGIWDGEGSIALFRNEEKNGSVKIKPVVNFVNTDIGIINEALRILHEADCSVYIVNRNQSTKNSKHRDVIEVRCSTIVGIKKILELISPYLRGDKKHKAEILLRYCARREQKFLQGDRSYDADDFNDLSEIRSSQTTREKPAFDSQIWL